MIQERVIGKVISIDNFRVYIKLSDDLKSLCKSGFEDIYDVARINSYIVIPVGADRIVAMINSVKSIDESEISSNKHAIYLTKATRYLVATMIGTIENGGRYIQGVYNYPILDNDVWYITKNDLDKIFDQKDDESEIDFNEDYYLPIGTSPAFSGYKIKINPDKFFGKHAAILGNTGSGKSCTLAAILQSLFAYDYNGKELQSAHIIIFDTNGEYKSAFDTTYKKLSLVNPYHIDKDGLKVPYWFMNYADMEYLFEPTSGTQGPVFKRAVSIAKGRISEEEQIDYIDPYLEAGILSILNGSPDDIKKRKHTSSYGNLVYNPNNSIKQAGEAIPENSQGIVLEIRNQLLILGGNIDLAAENSSIAILKALYSTYISTKNLSQINIDKNIDLPIWYNFTELITSYIDQAIEEQETSSNRIKEYVSTLRLRLQSYLNDTRIADPLLLKTDSTIDDSLARFIAFILGDYCKVYNSENDNLFCKYHQASEVEQEKPSQITIVDMSLLPADVLETITGLIGRLILEFVSRLNSEERAKLPIVIVLEEAQNYIPERNRKDKESIAKQVFERIAREGRKYGLSLLVSSQRPSELSKTVLSQCNSYVIHRLQNPEDQRYIKQLVSSANESILEQLPILPQQSAIILGDAVRTPVHAKINTANPRPNSNNSEFINEWLKEHRDGFPAYSDIAGRWEKGE